MMFRDTPEGVIGIPQPSHAWISGQLIRAWGNAEFGVVSPYDEVCFGAEQHDIGWLTWEQAPTMNLAAGRPHSFREIDVATHTSLWRQGTEMALVFGRYPALLASLHGTGLYAAFDYAAATEQDAAIARAFVAGQQETQRWLIESLRAEPDAIGVSDQEIERNRALVRTADRMSIAICTAMADLAISTDVPCEGIVRQVPTAAGVTDLRMTLVDGDVTKVAVSPWPFAAPAVRVVCEGVLLAPRRTRDLFADAPRRAIAAELTPGRETTERRI